jgi:hypothetical protein
MEKVQYLIRESTRSTRGSELGRSGVLVYIPPNQVIRRFGELSADL